MNEEKLATRHAIENHIQCQSDPAAGATTRSHQHTDTPRELRVKRRHHCGRRKPKFNKNNTIKDQLNLFLYPSVVPSTVSIFLI